MRALTLTQPWATLVAIGAKRFETRSWSTEYRGPLAIHAAKGLDSIGGKAGLFRVYKTQPFFRALAEADVCDLERDLPLGAIVAVAELRHCYPTEVILQARGYATEQEVAFGDFSRGRYAWHLKHARPLEQPLPCRGALGLWNLPAEIAAQLTAAVPA